MPLSKFTIYSHGAFMGYGYGRNERSALLDYACTLEGEKEFLPSHRGKLALLCNGRFYMAYAEILLPRAGGIPGDGWKASAIKD